MGLAARTLVRALRVLAARLATTLRRARRMLRAGTLRLALLTGALWLAVLERAGILRLALSPAATALRTLFARGARGGLALGGLALAALAGVA